MPQKRGVIESHKRIFQSHYFLRKWRMKRNKKASKIRGFFKNRKRIFQSHYFLRKWRMKN